IAGEVDLAVETRAEQAATMAFFEVVAEDALPDERVEVKIDDVARAVKVDRFARDPEFFGPAVRIPTVIDPFTERAHGALGLGLAAAGCNPSAPTPVIRVPSAHARDRRRRARSG